MPKRVTSKIKALPKSSSAKFLSNIPYENGFHFFTAIGCFTGITATSINEFAAKLEIVPAESVDFHFQRKDFQKWITETIGDKELAEAISIFGAARSAEVLRKEMLRIVRERIAELTRFRITNEGMTIRTVVPLQV
ncbi:MAG TPA: DUF5752 family protein [Candidatus Nanoarchaeia archaeon]|nr:DUF5752 family protein [Candidatus Nanoarchaeia archaeon]